MVTDNRTGAIKARRLIVIGVKEIVTVQSDRVMDSSCDMHYASLMAGLALSLLYHKVENRVVNS